MSISRRRLLMLSAGLIALPAMPSLLSITSKSDFLKYMKIFLNMDPVQLVATGRAVCSLHNSIAPIERVQALLGMPISGSGFFMWDELERLIKKDYAEEKIVYVLGWGMSETEAGLCGLYYLSAEGSAA